MILVTGATGSVGGQVAAQLAAAGAGVRALVRDPDKAKAVLPGSVERVRGDLGDPASVAAALDGVEAAFLMWPLHSPDRAPEVVAALARQVGRIVYLSAGGTTDDETVEPEPGIMGGHLTLERLVRASGAEWTMVRPGGFATNTLQWAPEIRAGGPVRLPFPGAARPLIHEADIAEVAVKALLTDELVGRTPELSGAEVLTQAEQIAVIGEVLGRPLTVEQVPWDEARADLLAAGLPPEYADGILTAHAQMETEPEATTPTFPALMGHPPRTYREWVRDHAADFR